MKCSARTRRTKAAIATIRDGLIALAEEHAPASVRQVFYLAVSAGLVAKSEAEYKSTVCRLLGDAREAGDLAWNTIVDHTRTFYRPETFTGIESALRETARTYRRNMWVNSDVHVEIWVEKDTLIGTLHRITSAYDIGLYPCRGYPSKSYLKDCAEDIEEADRDTRIYYFGDHDPSGVDIPRFVEDKLNDFAPYADITFHRLAVLPNQITEWSLPTRPTKASDSRSRTFEGESVEVEAIPPDRLREMCKDAITSHIDPHEWNVLVAAQKSEREMLRTFDYSRLSDMSDK